MTELLSSFGNTPIPNVLVTAGILFLLLAVAGRVGSNLSIPRRRQLIAATIGSVLLLGGVVIHLMPPSELQETVVPEISDPSSAEVLTSPLTNSESNVIESGDNSTNTIATGGSDVSN